MRHFEVMKRYTVIEIKPSPKNKWLSLQKWTRDMLECMLKIIVLMSPHISIPSLAVTFLFIPYLLKGWLLGIHCKTRKGTQPVPSWHYKGGKWKRPQVRFLCHLSNKYTSWIEQLLVILPVSTVDSLKVTFEKQPQELLGSARINFQKQEWGMVCRSVVGKTDKSSSRDGVSESYSIYPFKSFINLKVSYDRHKA